MNPNTLKLGDLVAYDNIDIEDPLLGVVVKISTGVVNGKVVLAKVIFMVPNGDYDEYAWMDVEDLRKLNV